LEVFFETIKAPSVELMERAVLLFLRYIVKIGGLKLYLSSKVIIFQMTKLIIREWSKNKTICDNRRGVIQTWSVLSTSQVFIQNRRYRADEGNTCRIVWISHWV
jgi:hypothetical protein